MEKIHTLTSKDIIDLIDIMSLDNNNNHHYHVACPVDIAVSTSALHVCRFCAR